MAALLGPFGIPITYCIDTSILLYNNWVVAPAGFILTIAAEPGSDEAKYYTWFRWFYFGPMRSAMNAAFLIFHIIGSFTNWIFYLFFPPLFFVSLAQGWAFAAYYDLAVDEFVGKPYYDKFLEFIDWWVEIGELAIESFKATIP